MWSVALTTEIKFSCSLAMRLKEPRHIKAWKYPLSLIARIQSKFEFWQIKTMSVSCYVQYSISHDPLRTGVNNSFTTDLRK